MRCLSVRTMQSPFLPLASLLFAAFSSASTFAANPLAPDFGSVREEHMMIPMRDGKRLSAYVFFQRAIERIKSGPRFSSHRRAFLRAKQPDRRQADE